ncbi:transcriptional regulator with XRE-family HTH domain [Pseudacidovorax intermedius]|uniref:Transcriptional regulator with XRE-family HTH domain n=1 Tax=Pseudacidovorax intermedius TaxID=433924 RepID=A0A370F8J1_9BURK|nr:helix-turn-helix transcriptional regulator [Pseudacidovorax intermedius]RDI20710.1 transcriptional regulator with XRE-family HTH domain [Pseudacidovorax intermedius]
MPDFSSRLVEVRKDRGLNQAEFGALGGVTKDSQLNYEKGVRKPDAAYLEALASTGVDVGYLITGQHSGAALTADQAALLRAYAGADEDARAALRLLAERVGGTVAIGRKGEG